MQLKREQAAELNREREEANFDLYKCKNKQIEKKSQF